MEGSEGGQAEVGEGGGERAAAMAKAEELLREYDAMFRSGATGAGGSVVVSASNAQKTLHAAQGLLEPLASAPSASADLCARLLVQAYEKEAMLLRQLAKSAGDNRQNRFLFFYQSSVVIEKALKYDPNNQDALNMLAVDLVNVACMMKSSPEQDQYFQRAYDSYKKVCDLTEGNSEKKSLHLMAVGNWANALEEQAERKTGKDADAIFQLSIDKYKEYVRKSAPSHGSKILLGMSVALQARAKNLEATGDAGQAKRIDRFYLAAAENYIAIIDHKKAKHKRLTPTNTLIGSINNYTMVLMNQARLRALHESHFPPFPQTCLSLLQECKKVIRNTVDQLPTELAEFADLLNQRLKEVETFEDMITFKSRMAEAHHHTKGL